MMKTIWIKILGLTGNDLEKEGEDVLVSEKIVRDPKKISIKGQTKSKIETKEEGWFIEEEGQLTLDLYEKDNFLIVESAIAGVKPTDLEINIEPDLLRIKGKRIKNEEKERNYFYRECFWGGFSRTVVLPVPVESEKAKALIDNGILSITIPKKKEEKEEIEIKSK